MMMVDLVEASFGVSEALDEAGPGQAATPGLLPLEAGEIFFLVDKGACIAVCKRVFLAMVGSWPRARRLRLLPKNPVCLARTHALRTFLPVCVVLLNHSR